MWPAVSSTTPEPTLPELSDSSADCESEPFWLPLEVAVMETTEGRALAETASASVVSSESIEIFCVDEPEAPAVTAFLPPPMLSVPLIMSAMTSRAPQAQPASAVIKIGSFLVLVLTTVCLFTTCWPPSGLPVCVS